MTSKMSIKTDKSDNEKKAAKKIKSSQREKDIEKKRNKQKLSTDEMSSTINTVRVLSYQTV